MTVANLLFDRPDAARILLIEPNSADATRIRALLQRSGFDVETVSDSATALSRLRDADLYDLVIVDLPGGDGIATLFKIRSLRGLRGRIPIIGFGAAMGQGHSIDRLAKPVPPPRLLERIRCRLAAVDPCAGGMRASNHPALEGSCRRIPPGRAAVALDLVHAQS